MKRFLKRKWHSIPIGIVAVLLALVLVAGSAFAAYGFWSATATVYVEEAIAVGAFDTWDNLHPYGSDTGAVWEYSEPTGTLGDVEMTLGVDGAGNPTLTISGEGGYVGHGFTAGEWIVIPLNIRSGSSGELTLGASVGGSSGDLDLDYTFEENPFPATSWGPEGQSLHREFKATETSWEPLVGWDVTISGPYGESGSAICGAKVLFVRILAPGDIEPDIYTFTIALTRD